jgi:hypothetical protein
MRNRPFTSSFALPRTFPALEYLVPKYFIPKANPPLCRCRRTGKLIQDGSPGKR